VIGSPGANDNASGIAADPRPSPPLEQLLASDKPDSEYIKDR